MISLIGKMCLWFALFFACLQCILPIWGYARKQIYLIASAKILALAQSTFIFGAYALLTCAFLINDFSITYVAANSHPNLPFIYRLTAVWGAHEGSILFWILLLCAWTCVFSWVNVAHPVFKSLTLALLGFINFGFIAFLLLTSNPFITTTLHLTGNDLNPLLQDPGLVIHPPMLYTGYVGLAVVFALTEAGLIQGKLDSAWAQLTRQFAIAAWCFLTLGITLGSWWAYHVLGWGGFWFWDPVENASLLPWLACTALIHVLVLVEKREFAIHWAALLGIICFALSLMGTFLVRSGLLVSVHTFANDPKRGIFLLGLLTLLLGIGLCIYGCRIHLSIKKNISKKNTFVICSREGGLLMNNAILITAMLTIALGTLYPMIIEVLHLGSLSVGAPYFNTVMLPLLFVMMMIMGIGPLLNWEEQSIYPLWQRIKKIIVISIVSAIGLITYSLQQIEMITFIGLMLSFWIVFSLKKVWRIYPAMSLAHLGFAVLIIGILFSSVLSLEREVKIKPGDITSIGPYQFLMLDVQGIKGANYRGLKANFDVIKNKRHITLLAPEKRIYTVRDMIMTKVDIHPGIFRDLYLALGEPLDDNYWSIRLYYKPMIRFIWLGGLLMMLGGMLAIFKRKAI